jgi:hypothetical protein
MTPRTKAEQLQALADFAALAELERIDALTAEEVRAELAAHGATSHAAPPASGTGRTRPKDDK